MPSARMYVCVSFDASLPVCVRVCLCVHMYMCVSIDASLPVCVRPFVSDSILDYLIYLLISQCLCFEINYLKLHNPHMRHKGL